MYIEKGWNNHQDVYILMKGDLEGEDSKNDLQDVNRKDTGRSKGYGRKPRRWTFPFAYFSMRSKVYGKRGLQKLWRWYWNRQG